MYICIFSNEFDLIQAICVSHTINYRTNKNKQDRPARSLSSLTL